MNDLIILVKHALPVLDAAVPPREWRLGEDGNAQAVHLAEDLRQFSPFRLVSSHEPKARATAEIVAARLSVETEVVDGIEEFDRPALPILSDSQHAVANKPIFDDPARRVLGVESGHEALERFEGALLELLRRRDDSMNLVAISHGTVISLFVAAHNDVDGFELWKRLACGSAVALRADTFALVQGVDGN